MDAQAASKPRIQRTRAALIAAGLDLLAQRPIDAIPIDDVVAYAGVAKGSFFNHFRDKHDFAAAVAAEVRAGLEARIASANAELADPVARLAGGMAVAADFALTQPDRARVLLRSQEPATRQTHPLNRGLKDDLEAALAQGALAAEAKTTGLLFWLGLCQMLMIHVTETRPCRAETAERLAGMLAMGLTGLGVDDRRKNAVVQTTLQRWTA